RENKPGEEDNGSDSGGAGATNSDRQVRKRARKSEKRWTSRTDPEASLITRNTWTKPMLAYKAHIAVDGGNARIVTAVETTTGGVAESQVLPGLLSKHIFQTHCRPKEAVADAAYGTREVYRFLDSMRIIPTIPRRQTWQKLRQQRIKAGFRYDPERDVYVCPYGKTLYRCKEQADGSVLYKVHRLACRGCPNQGTLCKAKRPSVKRYPDEELLFWVESHLKTEKAKASLRQRKYWPETVFAEMKGPRGLRRLTLRGITKAHIQVLLALTAHNIKQLVKRMGDKPKGTRADIRVTSIFCPVTVTSSPIVFTNPALKMRVWQQVRERYPAYWLKFSLAITLWIGCEARH
ncbi:MAG TPA: transposase, partial [Syntrophothermus lipocalidus]|nr:transposase [Syntrophothermus lipocalidus]